MSRIRITCKAPPPPPPCEPRALRVNGLLASMTDTIVELVDDDGVAHPIDCVSGVSFEVRADNEPARARLTVEDVELLAELDAVGVLLEERSWPPLPTRCEGRAHVRPVCATGVMAPPVPCRGSPLFANSGERKSQDTIPSPRIDTDPTE